LPAKARALGAALLACALFAGCAVLRDARLAQKSDQAPPGERTVTAAEAGIAPGTVLTLDQAIDTSLKFNPQMVQARQALKIAESQARDALAPYFPQISASASERTATSNTQAPTVTLPTVPGGKPKTSAPEYTNDTTDSYSAGFTLDQLLFDFGRTHYAVRQANMKKIAAKERLRETENELAYQVKLAYYRLLKAQSLLQVATEAEAQSKLRLEQVTVLKEVGRGIGADVARAEVDLAQARLDQVNARSELETARAGLNQAMGLASDPDYTLADPSREEISGTLDELMAQARERDPEFQALAAEEKAASAAVDYSIADLFPRLSATGSYNWSGTDFPLVWNWNIGPALAAEIFSGFTRVNQIEQAAAQLRSARSRKAAREQEVYRQLQTELAGLSGAREQLLLADAEAQSARQNFELVSERQRIGRATALEFADARVSLTRARSDQALALFQYQSAVAGIRRAAGGR
jgi:outer membrane protein TolC